MAAFNMTRTYGVEIEFAITSANKQLTAESIVTDISSTGITCKYLGYTHQDMAIWKMVTDSSCGYELVSPPMAGEDGFYQITKVCDVLHQYELLGRVKVTQACGLHVHHDAGDFTTQAFRNLFINYMKYEHAFDSVMPGSRRGNVNQYCQSLNARAFDSMQEAIDCIKGCKTISNISDAFGNSRYYKLNVEAYTRHGTIEFRQHYGTINAEQIINWIVLTNALITTSIEAKRIKSEYNSALDTMETMKWAVNAFKSRGADDLVINAIKYYEKRAKELNADVSLFAC